MSPQLAKDTYCSYCGKAFTTSGYPRTCEGCSTVIWSNPIPVVVALQPVRMNGKKGLLTVRRAIQPRKDLLALVGGFLEDHETYRDGGAREMREETGVIVEPSSLRPFWFTSTDPRPNRVLLFVEGDPLEASALPPAVVNAETSERGLVFGPRGLAEVFAFPLHARAAERWFLAHGIDGEHAFVSV